MNDPRVCLLIVLRDQHELLPELLAHLRPLNLPVLAIDDGSRLDSAARLDHLAAQTGMELIRLVRRSGKGIAVRAALDEAQRLGYTHALQHDIGDAYELAALEALIERSRRHPTTLFFGVPLDRQGQAPAPQLGALLAGMNAFSHRVRQARPGVRLYPIPSFNQMLARFPCGSGAEFDVESLIHWRWRDAPCEPHPLPLLTRRDGKGLTIAYAWASLLMHLRTTFGMLLRSPWLLRRLRRDREPQP
ncbi:glycosyltransferase family 2 protein [Halotalea alkalilenta]|uniref:Glycosyltransferase 2-like domain-containing protein n=1 Tax=Halotalea alkalilenta TaxID=376489 RepID=A0A172YCU4_9GAMM|nr:glycosyltransferase [Halotalea alkalilenta]ANF57057.1 hypothetical protein A5892_05900 [Halotalea alkalilenta]